MIADFDFVAVFDLVGVFVDVDPVELGDAGADGGDEAFALPAPVVLRVGEEVACEGVGGGLVEFESVVKRHVEVVGCLDVELDGER